MFFCLDREQLKILINHKISDSTVTDDYLRNLFTDSENWHCEIGLMNYFMAGIIESKIKNKDYNIEILDAYYQIPNEMYVVIDELSFDFIEYLLSVIPDQNLNLDENLIECLTNLGTFSYERKIRY